MSVKRKSKRKRSNVPFFYNIIDHNYDDETEVKIILRRLKEKESVDEDLANELYYKVERSEYFG